MYQFIMNIFVFLRDLLANFSDAIYERRTSINSVLLDISRENFNNFLDKQILNGELLSINMTFKEFFIYFGTLFIIVLCICLFIRFFLKLLGLFRLD